MPKEDTLSFGSDVDQRLKRAGAVISSSASIQRKEKAHAAVALLSISNRVGPSWAAKLIKMFDELIEMQQTV